MKAIAKMLIYTNYMLIKKIIIKKLYLRYLLRHHLSF